MSRYYCIHCEVPHEEGQGSCPLEQEKQGTPTAQADGLTYGELMLLCDGHGTSKIYERHCEVVDALRAQVLYERERNLNNVLNRGEELKDLRAQLAQVTQDLFDEKSLHVATQLCLTAQTESVQNCTRKLAEVTKDRDEQKAKWQDRRTNLLEYYNNELAERDATIAQGKNQLEAQHVTYMDNLTEIQILKARIAELEAALTRKATP